MSKEIQTRLASKELSSGDRVVLASGLTGLGLCHAVALAEMLESRGIDVKMWNGSMRGDDKRSTHPNVFYHNLPRRKGELEGKDWLITVGIPLNTRDLEGSRTGLAGAGVAKGVVSFEPKDIYENDWGADEQLLRLGRICARDGRVLPVTQEELEIARGIDAALMPLEGEDEKEGGEARILKAVEAMRERNWGYFREQGKRASERSGLRTMACLGDLMVFDSSEAGRRKKGVGLGKKMEARMGDKRFGLAFAFELPLSDRSDLSSLGAVTVMKRWDAEGDSLEEIMDNLGLGEGFVGPTDLKTWRGENGNEIGEIILGLTEKLGGVDIPDFGKLRVVGIVGDPNSGKSVFSEELVKLLNRFGVEAIRVDADLAAPTDSEYLEVRTKLEMAAEEVLEGDVDYEEARGLYTAWLLNEKKRRGQKGQWSDLLGGESRRRVEVAVANNPKAVLVVDFAGGLKNETGDQIEGPWFEAMGQVEEVIVVSRQVDSWEKYLRNKGIRVLGVLESRLTEEQQRPDLDRAGSGRGLVAGLARGREAIYNPVLVVMALGFVKASLGKRE